MGRNEKREKKHFRVLCGNRGEEEVFAYTRRHALAKVIVGMVSDKGLRNADEVLNWLVVEVR